MYGQNRESRLLSGAAVQTLKQERPQGPTSRNFHYRCSRRQGGHKWMSEVRERETTAECRVVGRSLSSAKRMPYAVQMEGVGCYITPNAGAERIGF